MISIEMKLISGIHDFQSGSSCLSCAQKYWIFCYLLPLEVFSKLCTGDKTSVWPRYLSRADLLTREAVRDENNQIKNLTPTLSFCYVNNRDLPWLTGAVCRSVFSWARNVRQVVSGDRERQSLCSHIPEDSQERRPSPGLKSHR